MDHDPCQWCGEEQRAPHALCQAALVFETGPVTLADIAKQLRDVPVEGTNRT